ncbi:MAG: GIY-YIG nuclease family protein [Gammaproteobacteria bacterium]|nr:GIY-YIG nuclease family protein [Gammaproteobacteria bacterium]
MQHKLNEASFAGTLNTPLLGTVTMYEWHLYILRTRHGTLYTGIATDVARRLLEHTGSRTRGAKYLRSRMPLKLAYQTKIGDQALALRAERQIKRLPRQRKEDIVTASPDSEQLLTMLGIVPTA